MDQAVDMAPENFPASQLRHELTPASGEYLPASQAEHVSESALEYVPATQSVHELAPELERVPASHVTQAVASCLENLRARARVRGCDEVVAGRTAILTDI